MGSRSPSNPQTRADIEHVLEHGYVILEDCFSKAEAEDAKKEIRRLSGDSPEPGRNPFEGLKTNRIYALLNKTRKLDKFTVLPRVIALNDYFLDEGYNISSFHSIQINPGEEPQGLHHDDQFTNLPRPRPPLGTAIIAAFDDFTPENGSTRIIPGSHKWTSDRTGQQAETISAVCPAGSVVYFISTTWHGGGRNTASIPRMSLTVQYCQPYMRQIENQFLAVDPRKLDEIPETIVRMMGYRTHKPFIGYVDGLNPREGARRMLKRLEQPVNFDPSAFAHHRDTKL
ncbi:phytanoyl-CoA dioxygenase [Tothia fuscella]|uniref:Phytanoyl-CoA dioxygenase n=1 Tax=Tothia fuscella TaxID=1048955 RepID=A0A9P4NVL0_9PEZI|nr:phytanoyl-CoA dioxygenase [Tothia fuscella]